MPLDSQMSRLQASLWKFLLEYFIGPENGASREKVLARYNAWHSSQIIDRDFREVVSDLVVNFKKPICTSPSGGYYVARTPDELDISIRYLEKTGGAFFERARSLKEAIPLQRQGNLL